MKRCRPAAALAGLLAALLVTAAPAAGQQPEPTKEQEILKLIEVSRADSIGRQIAESITGQMVERYSAARPDLSPQHLEMLTGETRSIVSEHMPLLQETIVELYCERFSREEIREMTAFFLTPTGQKLVAQQGELFAESVELGRSWGRAIVPLIRDRLDQRILEIDN